MYLYSLFRLALVSFIFAMLLPATTVWAGPDCRDPKHAGNPNCPPPDDPPPPAPSLTYTVELMGRVFNFDSMDVTPNGKENTLFPDAGETLKFSCPGVLSTVCDPDGYSEEKAACVWDAMFAACENFFGPDPILGGGTDPNFGLRVRGYG